MAKKRLTKLVDDQDKFFAWLKKCPYTFKYRYETLICQWLFF